MGVIKKNDSILGTFESSSVESLGLTIPESSDDEIATAPTIELNFNAGYTHRRNPAIPATFCLRRKYLGRKRERRYENVNQLVTLVEEDELGEPTIDDFMSRQTIFSKLFHDENNMQLWHNFINSSEEMQAAVLSTPQTQSVKKPNQHLSSKTITPEEAFLSIKRGIRHTLRRKHMPLGMIQYLEDEVLDFFSHDPKSMFVSSDLSGFERLLLHGISQYHHLHSQSFGNNTGRRVRISNSFGSFQVPSLSLWQYLECAYSQLGS